MNNSVRNQAAEELNEDSYAFAESINDMVDEVLEETGNKMPSISELLPEAEKIEKTLKKISPAGSGLSPVATSFKPQPLKPATKPVFESPLKKHHNDSDNSDPLEITEQESFTSQVETAEIRSEVEALGNRLKNIENTIESLLSERTNLPTHLDRLNTSITQQFTTMNERLNAAIESGTVSGALSQAVVDAKNITSSAKEVVDTITGDLSQPPSQSSQVSKPDVISSSRRRVRLIR